MASAMASSQSHLDLVQLLIVVVMTMTMLVGGGEALSLDYYAKSCPKAEAAVAAAVKQAMAKDRTVPAGLLRLHFHDCFVRVTS
jgi:peroxidase